MEWGGGGCSMLASHGWLRTVARGMKQSPTPGAMDHARMALLCQAEALWSHGSCQDGSPMLGSSPGTQIVPGWHTLCQRILPSPQPQVQQSLLWGKEGKGQSAPLLPQEGGWSLSSDTEGSVIFWQKVKPRSGEMGVPKGTQIAPLTTAGSCFPKKKTKSSSSEHVIRP